MKIINTRKVNCKDCYRCVRSCPVKAIGITNGHAQVMDDRCILCGKCVIECPQHAKKIVTHIPRIEEAIRQGKRVVLSIGSSFWGLFPNYTQSQIISALKKMGFSHVEEVAIGAEAVSLAYRELMNNDPQKTVISSNCPVVVNTIKKYYPSLVEYLAPIVSPMMAHGSLIKQKYGQDTFTVFAGSCLAKFDEDTEHHYIDAVLTFVQLRQWLNQTYKGVLPEPTEEYIPPVIGNARFFPLAGGILKSFMDFDILDSEIITVDGIENCHEVFRSLKKGEIAPRFVEAFSCRGGCIGGPFGGSGIPIPVRRMRAIKFGNSLDAKRTIEVPEGLDLHLDHQPTPLQSLIPSEEEIQKVLHKTGKFTKADEKNCGSCGYSTCREKAVAVLRGLAEIDMCLPYMRSKAESFANLIVENSVDGILVVDNLMTIQEVNPAFKQMFGLEKIIEKGMSLTEFVSCVDYVQVATFGNKVVQKRIDYPDYGLITDQMIVPLPEHGLVLIVISNVTEEQRRTEAMKKMKDETIEKANEIINRQMKVAQEIAGLLGETTAETKSALLEMMYVLKGGEEK
ncbi:MAG: 4Fe-4S binding protein [Selenomonadales bacterium]|nr:4Fe-4S binding protein [Selenomonadales bacterium]